MKDCSHFDKHSELIRELRTPRVGRVEVDETSPNGFRVVADPEAIKDLCARAADALEASALSHERASEKTASQVPATATSGTEGEIAAYGGEVADQRPVDTPAVLSSIEPMKKPPCGWQPWGALVNDWLDQWGDLANMRAADLWDRIAAMLAKGEK